MRGWEPAVTESSTDQATSSAWTAATTPMNFFSAIHNLQPAVQADMHWKMWRLNISHTTHTWRSLIMRLQFAPHTARSLNVRSCANTA